MNHKVLLVFVLALLLFSGQKLKRFVLNYQ